MVAIATPFDAELAKINTEMARSTLTFGRGEAKAKADDSVKGALALPAPAAPGTLTLTAQFDGNGTTEPHEPAASRLSVQVVARAQHTLTVTVAASGMPLADEVVRLGPYRTPTDASGIAKVRLARGRYELVVWKTGYAMTATPVAVEADAAIAVVTEPLPAENPDAVWTA